MGERKLSKGAERRSENDKSSSSPIIFFFLKKSVSKVCRILCEILAQNNFSIFFPPLRRLFPFPGPFEISANPVRAALSCKKKMKKHPPFSVSNFIVWKEKDKTLFAVSANGQGRMFLVKYFLLYCVQAKMDIAYGGEIEVAAKICNSKEGERKGVRETCVHT